MELPTTYIATYAKHAAYCALQNESNIPQEIILLIVQRTTRPIEIHTLIDLSIVYARHYPAQLHQLFQSQYNLYPSQLTVSITSDVVPTFVSLLSSHTHNALASKSKISESIISFLTACARIPPLVREFAHSRDFILALARLYDSGLTSIARSHGGSHVLLSQTTRDTDDWPLIWIQTKIALIDSFHIILTSLFDDLSSPPSKFEKDRVFDTLFALLSIEVAQPTSPSTPFLNLSLVADYQHAYNFTDKLSSILCPSSDRERDPRLDLLETSLAALLSGVEHKNPGVLTTVLRSKSTKIPAKSDSFTQPIARPPSNNANNREELSSMESKTAQILAILPHLSESHVTRHLRDDRFGGNVERVLEGLLDGSLGPEEGDIDEKEKASGKGKERENSKVEEKADAVEYDVTQRRNVFDDEELNITRIRVGKRDVGSNFLQDRSTIEHLKRDILRRVEEMEEAEAELLEEEESNRKGKDKVEARVRPDDVYDDEIASGMSNIRVLGDGESDTDSSGSDDSGVEPETLIEQAYLRDPSIFDRDANTRRGKARIELRNLTGWADEQIEGWKVMLERTPWKKAKLEEKLAFSGNVKGLEVPLFVAGPSRGGRGRRPIRGGNGNGGGESSRGFKRGGGRGRGGSNRKRGHDRKIARAGGVA